MDVIKKDVEKNYTVKSRKELDSIKSFIRPLTNSKISSIRYNESNHTWSIWVQSKSTRDLKELEKKFFKKNWVTELKSIFLSLIK